MKKTLTLLNLASVILVITVNYVSQSIRINETTIGEISNKYFNLFTPAGYAFAIWGLIFLGLLAYVIFQVRRAFFSNKESDFIEQTGYWFIIANVLNCSWVLAFSFDYTGLSVLIMLGILFSLLKIIVKTNMERWDAPFEVIVFAWWPICIYSGWIAVATIANFSAYFVKIGWNGAPLSATTWTIIMIIIAAIVNIYMISTRNLREFAAVGVWALFAIYIRHTGNMEAIAYTALAGSVLLLAAILWHGYQNRRSNVFIKFQERLRKS